MRVFRRLCGAVLLTAAVLWAGGAAAQTQSAPRTFNPGLYSRIQPSAQVDVPRVPDVRGRPVGEARAILNRYNLGANVISRQVPRYQAGTVIDQSPAPQTPARGVGEVTLYVAAEAPPQRTMPDVRGRPVQFGRMILARLGIAAQTRDRQTDTASPGIILDQRPGPGTPVNSDTAAVLLVAVAPPQQQPPPPVYTPPPPRWNPPPGQPPPSQPPPPRSEVVTMPNLIGRTRDEAAALVAGAHLRGPTVSAAPSDAVVAGRVMEQQPASQSLVTAGTATRVTLSSGPQPKPPPVATPPPPPPPPPPAVRPTPTPPPPRPRPAPPPAKPAPKAPTPAPAPATQPPAAVATAAPPPAAPPPTSPPPPVVVPPASPPPPVVVPPAHHTPWGLIAAAVVGAIAALGALAALAGAALIRVRPGWDPSMEMDAQVDHPPAGPGVVLSSHVDPGETEISIAPPKPDAGGGATES